MNGDEIRDRVVVTAVVVTVVLSVLRVAGVWELPWVWVLAPVWGLLVLAFAGSGLALVWVLARMVVSPRR